MKKQSIATTVDQDRDYYDIYSSKRSLKSIAKEVPEHFTQISSYSDWSYLCFGALYLLQCTRKPHEARMLLDKLESRQISLTVCTNIPKHAQQLCETSRLLGYIKTALEAIQEIDAKGGDINITLCQFLKFTDKEPNIRFSVGVLVRCLLIHQCKDTLRQRKDQFLGNQLQVIADLSATPAYKVHSLLSETFNYSLKVQNPLHKIEKNYTQPNSQTDLDVIVHKGRTYCLIKTKEEMIGPIRKRVQSHACIRTRKATLDSETESQKECYKVQKKQPQRQDKTIGKDSPRKFMKSQVEDKRIKVCLSCGQSRNADQKFCQCRKQKSQVSRPVESGI